MKLLFYLFIFSFNALFMCCSSAQTSSSVENDYMPLAIGNKWYYNVHTANTEVGSETSTITEVIRIDTIKGKIYFQLKYENVNSDKKPYYYHQRISNDTLYTLNYEEKYKDYSERVTAIFSLESGDVARIELPETELTLKYKSDGLPTGRRYSIKAVNKDEDTIEFFTNIAIDVESTEIYKKGVGMIKSKGGWGIISELIDFELND
jgi:hypothetical protein